MWFVFTESFLCTKEFATWITSYDAQHAFLTGEWPLNASVKNMWLVCVEVIRVWCGSGNIGGRAGGDGAGVENEIHICQKRSRRKRWIQASYLLMWRSWDRHPAQEVLTHRSCTSVPTGFCGGDLTHLAQAILIQRSCTGGFTGPLCKDLDTEILDKRSA